VPDHQPRDERREANDEQQPHRLQGQHKAAMIATESMPPGLVAR
jgi:hypothetical protein